MISSIYVYYKHLILSLKFKCTMTNVLSIYLYKIFYTQYTYFLSKIITENDFLNSSLLIYLI